MPSQQRANPSATRQPSPGRGPAPGASFGSPGRITSAYNFAPLHAGVVCPPWQHRVSHDVPLHDGICATLRIRVTAHTPILVGAERDPGRKANGVQTVEFYRHPDGTPALPGSSMRGMVRNVLEIASFARMQRIDDRALSLRDLYLKAYTSRITRTKGSVYEATVRTGWLRYDAQHGWRIHECEHGRIEQSELRKLTLPSKKALAPEQRIKLWQALDDAFRKAGSGDAARMASFKYRAIEGMVGRLPLKGDRTPQDYTHSPDRQGRPKTLRYRRLEIAGPTDRQFAGYLVLTGQPGKFEGPSDDHKAGTKHMEFVFLDPVGPPGSIHQVDGPVMARFKQVHESSPDYAFLAGPESPHVARGVPVFFLTDSQGRPEHLGIAQMFRLAGPRTLGQIAAAQQGPRSEALPLDFVETLFGHVDAPGGSLKGRVSFGDCRASATGAGAPRAAPDRFGAPTVLGQPKPSFYPSYLAQGEKSEKSGVLDNAEYQTILNADTRLRGWKRYPVRPAGEVTVAEPPPKSSADTQVALRPLDQGTVFEGSVHLHNVTREELGGVLWALTWGGRAGLRHALGMGKPFGFGQVSVEVVSSQIESNDATVAPVDAAAAIQAFETFMSSQPGLERWLDTPSMRELVAMADPALPQATRGTLRPLTLSVGGTNEFAQAKNRDSRWVLQRYSAMQPPAR